MNRNVAVVLFLLAWAGAAWIFSGQNRWQTIKAWVAAPASSTVPAPPKPDENAELPAVDRQAPYVLRLESGAAADRVTWLLTVDDAVQGYAYAAGETYDAYGTVATATNQLAFAAYRDTGETLAAATGTWRGAGFAGEARFGAAVSALRRTEAPAAAVLSFERTAGSWEDARRNMGCTFALTLPRVQPGTGLSTAVAERINQEIRRSLLRPVSFSITGGPAFRSSPLQLKNDFLRVCQMELAEERAAWKGAGEPGGIFQRSEETSVRVSYNQGGWLSFTADTATYTGGAHGGVLRQAFVFDTRTGDRLSLDNLIRPDRQARFGQLVAGEVLRSHADALFAETMDALGAFAAADPARAEELWAQGLSGLSTSTVFALVPEGLQVIFQQYEIAPYAYGLPEVVLPAERWRDLAAPGRRLPF